MITGEPAMDAPADPAGEGPAGEGEESEDHSEAGPARLRKAPNAFRTISEVADELHIPQHVLRFWETRFPQVKPLKRGGGRRYYRPDDIALLRRISDLLYIQGYTIKGVQRLLREGGGKLSDNIPPPAPEERDEESGRADMRAAERDPLSGAADPALPPRTDEEGAPEEAAEREALARLRALLQPVLKELEALRALLP